MEILESETFEFETFKLETFEFGILNIELFQFETNELAILYDTSLDVLFVIWRQLNLKQLIYISFLLIKK